MEKRIGATTQDKLWPSGKQQAGYRDTASIPEVSYEICFDVSYAIDEIDVIIGTALLS